MAYGEKKTKCICPRCEREHIRRFYWTGDGVPRVYCIPCKNIVEKSGKFYGLSGSSGKMKHPILSY